MIRLLQGGFKGRIKPQIHMNQITKPILHQIKPSHGQYSTTTNFQFNFQELAVNLKTMASTAPDGSKAEDEGNSPSFHFFPLLPFELRIQIWTLALPEPRIINLQMQPNCPNLHKAWCLTPSPPPCHKYVISGLMPPEDITFRCSILPSEEPINEPDTVLEDNSRMRRSRRFFMILDEDGKRVGSGERKIWIDFKRDLVFFNTTRNWGDQTDQYVVLYALKEYCREDIRKIRKMGLGGYYWWMVDEWDLLTDMYRSTGHRFPSFPRAIMQGIVGLPGWLNAFQSLEELYLWDEFREKKAPTSWKAVDDRETIERDVAETLERQREGGGWDVDRKLPLIRVLRKPERVW
ncbi:hypothetical protein G7Y89_g10934 [Cudoniella acicularis]|uniref:2EXR domain-containing protein n=1 Tax=Cudoniella acicularis TaxID=354080 RepID=A0A8H4VYR4_9HELO|nr:hypothetical protein G7Y89_g10934 [Cudoniella acicularis]